MNLEPKPNQIAGKGDDEIVLESRFTSRAGRQAPARLRRFCIFLLILSCLFFGPLRNLIRLAMGSELHSHILLIPIVSAWLVYLRRDCLPPESSRSFAWSLSLSAIAASLLAARFAVPGFFTRLSPNDHLALTILAFVCFVAAGGFAFLGKAWMRELCFPFAFLIFMIPLPDELVSGLETASKLASADAANLFFNLSGTPLMRHGNVFQLPGMVIEVAQECSGIRSSLVLFITSLLVAYLFLKTSWRRIALVAFVIPLGILRNGFRILVIGLLCVHYGPRMIHSIIHRKGGPVFFLLSLIPLFLFLWWLRRGESGASDGKETAVATINPLPKSEGGV
jgi:exosortase C (VPDSG-CTERM-specific)